MIFQTLMLLLQNGKLRLSYTNPLTVPVTVRANAVGFGATSNADGTLRFKMQRLKQMEMKEVHSSQVTL